jgi:hypothetical protein
MEDGMATKKNQMKDMSAEIRAADALRLRRQHLPWREIAQRCGFAGPSGAHSAVKRLLAAEIRQDVEEMREERGADLMAVLAWLQPRIFDPGVDEDKAPWLIDRYLRTQAQLVSLYGLALSGDEIQARTPWTKRIVLEDGPLQPPSPVVDEEGPQING